MKTIKTETHLLLVDETAERPKIGAWYHNDGNIFCCVNDYAIPKSDEILAASPKLGDLPEFETLSPNERVINKIVKNETY